jgi:LacI family transcriptional regulator
VRVTEQLIQHGVDAFAFVGIDHDGALSLLERYGAPYVLTWGVDARGLHPAIGFDNAAATHALPTGCRARHRRFGAHQRADRGQRPRARRGAGVRRALAAHGLALDEHDVCYGRSRSPPGRRHARAARAAPRRRPSSRPTTCSRSAR